VTRPTNVELIAWIIATLAFSLAAMVAFGVIL
jgi:hypothetical protein